MKFRILITAICLGFLVSLIIIFTIKPWEESKKKELAVPNQITLGYSPLILNLPVIIAYEKGFFTENNLNVKMEKMSTTDAMRDAVSIGKLNFASALGTDMFFKNNNLADGNLVGIYFNVISEERYVDAIITKNDSNINEIKDLENKIVGTYPAATTQVFLNLIGKNAKVNFIVTPINPKEALEALGTNKIDALFVLEPQLTIAIKKGFKVIEKSLIARRIKDKMPVGVHVVNGKFATNYPDIVAKFQTSIDKSVDFIENNKKESSGVMGQ